MTPNSPSTPAPPPPGKSKAPLIAVVVALLAIAGGAFVALRGRTSGGETTSPGEAPSSAAEAAARVRQSAFDTGDRPEPTFVALTPIAHSSPLFWVDVRDPKVTHSALQKNAWLTKVMKEPLGQGFMAAWSGFFGTRGKDIGGGFEGTVFSLAVNQVLDGPYKLVWFGGEGVQGAPVLVAPQPSAKAVTAFDALVKVAGSGGFTLSGCAGEATQWASGRPSETIQRVVLADKTLYGVHTGDRLVLSTNPQAVQNSMCDELKAPASKPGVAVSLTFSFAEGGRATQSLADLVGINDTIALDFGVANDAFVPLSVDTELKRATFVSAEPSEALLKAIPQNAGVVLFLALRLPAELTGPALNAALAPEAEVDAKAVTRQVALVWNPRATGAGDELMVLWARTEDERSLDKAMQGGTGALKAVKGCSSILAFATARAAPILEATCKGSTPSMLQAPAPIVKGLTESSSFTLTIGLGQVLSQLALDGFVSEHGQKVAAEIESARKLLEELPSIGFSGAVQADKKLVTKGFRS